MPHGVELDPFSIRLVAERRGLDLIGQWFDSRGQALEPFSFALPLDDQDLEDLTWYLEEYPRFAGAGDRERAAEIANKIRVWGTELFSSLCPGERERCLIESLENHTRVEGEVGTLRLCSSDTAFLSQPWEMLVRADSVSPLFLEGLNVVREIPGPHTAGGPTVIQQPLRILMIVSRPRDAIFLNPRATATQLIDVIARLPKGSAEVEFCNPPTFSALKEALQRASAAGRQFHVVHFDGHGEFHQRAGTGFLLFENEKNGFATARIDANRFGDLLTEHSVPMVILEACKTSAAANSPVLNSTARTLLDSGITSVLAFSHSILAQASRLFMASFYTSFVERRQSLGKSVSTGRLELYNCRERLVAPGSGEIQLHDWFTLQVFLSGDISLERNVEPVETPSLAEGGEERELPPKLESGFFGRERELLRLERLLLRSPAALLFGLAGVGKTSLASEASRWWVSKGFFEQVIFYSFRTSARLERMVQSVGLAIEGASFNQRPPEAQVEYLVEHFHKHRVLIVWDNFESTLTDHSNAGRQWDSPSADREEMNRLFCRLTSSNPIGRLLITSRTQDVDLESIETLHVGGLTDEDSLQFMSQLLAKQAGPVYLLGDNTAEMIELLAAFDHHPLCIAMLAPRLKNSSAKDILHAVKERTKLSPEGVIADSSLVARVRLLSASLSEPASSLLSTAAWFIGGVHEEYFLGFAKVEKQVWPEILQELLQTGLIQVENVGPNRFLRFHPLLGMAFPRSSNTKDNAQARFIDLYATEAVVARKNIYTRDPAHVLRAVFVEEGNFISSLRAAVAANVKDRALALFRLLDTFFRISGRFGEAVELNKWLGGFGSGVKSDSSLDFASQVVTAKALAHSEEGNHEEAARTIRDLISRIEPAVSESDDESLIYELAQSYRSLGQVLVEARRPVEAAEASRKAASLFGEISDIDAIPDLIICLGDFVNAMKVLGDHETAFGISKKLYEISVSRDELRGATTACGLCADSLRNAGRFAEAKTWYLRALRYARHYGDIENEGITLQHLAIVEMELGNATQSVDLGQQAIALLSKGPKAKEEMQTAGILGVAELDLGNFGAAEAWLRRSKELADRRNDNIQLAIIASNFGELHQKRSEMCKDALSRESELKKALIQAERSLVLRLSIGDEVRVSQSLYQVGMLCYLLGGDSHRTAKQHLTQALEISKRLQLPFLHTIYMGLAHVSGAQGHGGERLKWLLEYEFEIERLADSGGTRFPSAFAGMVQSIRKHGQAIVEARSKEAVSQQDFFFFAQMATQPEPFATAGKFFMSLFSEPEVPPIPTRLPRVLRNVILELTVGL